MIKIADKDGSGVVEFQEFMEMICDQVEVRNEMIIADFTMSSSNLSPFNKIFY